ncbi:MAG: hypothetical protein DGJ47_000605 [Rickettsiaceae bacterium]
MAFKVKILNDNIIEKMKYHHIWTKKCPVPLSDLVLIELIHYDFHYQKTIGEIIVHKKVASSTVKIFKQLYDIKFPIHSVKLIDEFAGDDNLSMSMNNSSGFNYRKIENSDLISMHSYGLAIDINPVQNPYIINPGSDNEKIIPEKSNEFRDRSRQRLGMVEKIVHIFQNNEFSEWGGEWSAPVDYHHFQFPRKRLSEIITL